MFGILSDPKRHTQPPVGRPRKHPKHAARLGSQQVVFDSGAGASAHGDQQQYTTSTRPENLTPSAAPPADPLPADPSPAPRSMAMAGERRNSFDASRPALPHSADEVVASCNNCDKFVGRFQNKWEQITNAYYANGDLATGEMAKLQNLQANVPPKNPGGSNKTFEGCLIQPLECPSCFDTLAFKCLESVADKMSYKGRIFYRLSKMRLSSSANQNIEPVVDRASRDSEGRDSMLGQVSPIIRSSHSYSPEPTRDNTRTVVAQADREAIEATNNASLSWKEAHENWTRITGLTLSPNSFAKRIKDFGGGNWAKAAAGARSTPESPIPGRALVNGGFQPANKSIQQSQPVPHRSPQYQHMPPPRSHEPLPPIYGSRSTPDSLARQRDDINRIEDKLSNLQTSVDALSQAISGFRRQQADGDSIELLTETVSKLSSQIGDIDGLRLATDSFKRRLRRLEESAGVASPAPTQHVSYATVTNSHSDVLRQPSPKRQRVSGGHTNGDYSNPVPSAQTPFQSRQNEPALSTRTRDSSAGWRPAPDRAPWVVEAGDHRGRGRPRKNESVYRQDDLGTPPWERSNRQSEEEEEDPNEYYRALLHPPPQSTDRGRVIRRGTSGGAVETIKRTRQRPVRNAEGILLRKDGKPDQRSFSSPINLRKTFGKRKEQFERRGSLLSSSKQSPQADHDTDESHAEKPAVAESAKQAQLVRKGSQGHEAIMKQMFPNGLSEDARRLNHAANIFSPGRSPERERMLPRKEMQREELAAVRAVRDSAEPGTDTRVDDPDSAMIDAPSASTVPTIPPTANANSEGVREVPETPAEVNSVSSTTQASVSSDKPPISSAKRVPPANESQESYRPDTSSEI